MVSKKLEEMVNKRKQEAIDKNFIEKACVIAKELVDLRKGNWYTSFSFEFKYAGLELYLQSWGNRAAITYDELTTSLYQMSYNEEEFFSAFVKDGNATLSGNIEINTYISGEGEEKFEKLYKRANNRIERRVGTKKQEERKKAEELKKKFGL